MSKPPPHIQKSIKTQKRVNQHSAKTMPSDPIIPKKSKFIFPKLFLTVNGTVVIPSGIGCQANIRDLS